ncbi:DUF6124 family protein [Pseudomonas sp. PP3]|uniref:DUF6124 family protein n=1 Tax=Pseudomonas sp. PP3 TaxID=2815936 RepID=UPI001BAFDFE9|nr:DUF6124 family protein [Pseudomonas sp. PP3]
MSKKVPDPPASESEQPERKGSLFTVSPNINTETLLANASEDLLSISAIAADLADNVDGSRRFKALALSRMADGVHLLVERALDHLDEPEMAAIFAMQQNKPLTLRCRPKNRRVSRPE